MASAIKKKKSSISNNPSSGGGLLTSQAATSNRNQIGSKGKDSLKTLIAGTQIDSPYRKKRPSEVVTAQNEIKIGKNLESPGEEASVNGQAKQRSFLLDLDVKSMSYLCGSPLETRSGTRNHRGYSLLNQPKSFVEHDDDDADDSSRNDGLCGPKKQKAVTGRHALTKQIFPDLAFLGYGIVSILALTADERRQKRKNRHFQNQTQRTRVIFADGVASLQSLQSQQLHNNTSLTEENRVVSQKVRSEVASQEDSNVFQTQSPRDYVQIVNREKDDGASMSVNTRGYQAFMGKSGVLARDEATNWAPFNTQTITIPNSTIEAIGHHTLAVGDDPIRVTLDGSIDSKQGGQSKRILAESSLESPRGASLKSLRPNGDQKKRQVANTSRTINKTSPSKLSQNKKVSQPPSKPVVGRSQPSKKQPVPGTTSQKKVSSLVKTPAATAAQKRQNSTQVSSQSPRKQPATQESTNKFVQRKLRGEGSDLNSASPHQQSRGRVPATTRNLQKGQVMTKTQAEIKNKKSVTPQRVQPPQPQMHHLTQASAEPMAQKAPKAGLNWQKRSQDKIMLTSKQNSKSTKQAPPIRPGLKRFKTQTKDVDPQQQIAENKSNFNVMEEGGETSMFSEDLSTNPALIEAVQADGSGAKLVKLPQTLGLLQSAANEEMGRMSDVGQLSIVESDGDGLETPGADRSFRDKGGFHSSLRSSHKLKSPRSKVEDITTPNEIKQRQNKTTINIQDTDEAVIQEESFAVSRPSAIKPSKRALHYLSSNDSNILAHSINSPFKTKTDTLQSNLPGKWKPSGKNKTSHGPEKSGDPARSPVNYESDQRKNSVSYRQTHQNGPSPARTDQTAFRRSVTNAKDEKRQSSNHNNSSIEEKIRRKNRVQNMPMQKNARAQQKQHQFVDSDFFDNVSINRKTHHKINLESARRKMGSTSPVSSKASFLRNDVSLRSRRDKEHNQTKSSILMDSDYTLSKIVTQKSDSPLHKVEKPRVQKSPPQVSNTTAQIDTEITKLKQKAEKMMLQSQRRQWVLSHMYQKKFIERREKQVQIINRQVTEQSDCEQTKNLAYAITQGTGYDSSNHLFDEKVRERRDMIMQRRGGLETLKKLHDSLGIDSSRDQQSKRRIKNFNLNARKHVSPLVTQSISDARKQQNRSITKSKQTHIRNATQEYSSVADSGGVVSHPSLVHFGEDSKDMRPNQRSVISHATSNNQDQGRGDVMDASNEQAGYNLTSDESSLRKAHEQFNVNTSEEQQAQARIDPKPTAKMFKTECPSPSFAASYMMQGNSQSYMTSMPKPFKVPKIQAPAQWQNIVEQKFNLVDGDFVAGKASRSVQKVNMLSNTTAPLNKSRLQVTNDSPRGGLNYKSISDRKKSHELTSIRNQATSDEERLNKLTKFSLGRQLEQQRQQQQMGTGRDDPANLLGYQKLKKAALPASMRGARNANQPYSMERRTVAALESGQQHVAMMDSMTTATQKYIYTMLSDLNRVKTMRIANQVVKEQQQNLHSANKQRREMINSHGSADYRNLTRVNKASYSNLNRPQNLQISANYGSIAAMMSSNQSPADCASPIQDFQHLSVPNSSTILNSTHDFKSKGLLLRQGLGHQLSQKRTDPIMMKEGQDSRGIVTLNKPQTPLSSTGLRIMQTKQQ